MGSAAARHLSSKLPYLSSVARIDERSGYRFVPAGCSSGTFWAEFLFVKVDAMPMRRDEMRRGR